MKKGFLLIAHGSPRKKANEAFSKLAADIQKRTYDFWVGHAFLDKVKPSIPEAIKLLAAKEIHELVILPFFLTEGKHTTTDIPAIIEEVKHDYPELHFKMKSPLGISLEIPNLILRLMSED